MSGLLPPPDDLACRELVELVTGHLEGVLDPLTTQRVLEHLARCDDCGAYLEQIRVTADLAAGSPEPVSLRLRSALLREFRSSRR